MVNESTSLSKNMPNYEPLDIRHYIESEIKYFKDRRWFKGIDEHREISEIDMNEEIILIEKEFRKWYYMKFSSDKTKVKDLANTKL